MKGKMFISSAFTGSVEYICVEELDAVVALMEPTTQAIIWETKNSVTRHYTLKGK